MQYHLNGFEAGDPSVMKVHDKAGNTSDNEVDVLIVGCGPAGLTLAAQLSFFPEIVTKRNAFTKPFLTLLCEYDNLKLCTLLERIAYPEIAKFSALDDPNPEIGCLLE